MLREVKTQITLFYITILGHDGCSIAIFCFYILQILFFKILWNCDTQAQELTNLRIWILYNVYLSHVMHIYATRENSSLTLFYVA